VPEGHFLVAAKVLEAPRVPGGAGRRMRPRVADPVVGSAPVLDLNAGQSIPELPNSP